MNDVTFAPSAWDDYLEWQSEDKRTVARINALIKDIQRNGMMKVSVNRRRCAAAKDTAAALTNTIGSYTMATKTGICGLSPAKAITTTEKISLSEAQEQGYDPCTVCDPPY